MSSTYFLENSLLELLIKATLKETLGSLPKIPPKTTKNISGKTIVKNKARRSRKNRLVLSFTKT